MNKTLFFLLLITITPLFPMNSVNGGKKRVTFNLPTKNKYQKEQLKLEKEAKKNLKLLEEFVNQLKKY